MRRIKTIISKLISPIKSIGLRGLMAFIFMFNVQCSMFNVYGQIRIGGNVYGGGNQGNVEGSTKVEVKAGDIGTRYTNDDEPLKNPRGKVFGGARMANVGGNTSVNVTCKTASDYIVVNQVFGGNDISGNIGTANLPAWLSQQDATAKGVDNTWNSYVHIGTTTGANYTQAECDAYNATLTGAVSTTDTNPSTNTNYTPEEAKTHNAGLKGAKTTSNKKEGKIYIGQVFAGGNGEYDYEQQPDGNGKIIHTIKNVGENTVIATKITEPGETGFNRPELQKTFLDLEGGSIDYVYGGGNNATITEETVIHYDNPSEVVISIKDERITSKNTGEDEHDGELLIDARFRDMGINLALSYPSSDAFQVGRLFGGNNMAEMAIRPKWDLQSGKVRNLYSGGNKGAMTSPVGLLLEIPETSTLKVDNVFGGCRMADVVPLISGTLDTSDDDDPTKEAKKVDIADIKLEDPKYKFPPGLSARLVIAGGDINNVYGGNDITGKVTGGNAVGIRTSIRGDVYGGGNGAYAYTDNQGLAIHPYYKDLYFNAGGSTLQDLNNFRPNAEQVSIHLRGKSADEPTIIRGKVFLGGNCATLKSSMENPLVELKIGSYVIAENIFLGNNGEGMIDETTLKYYAMGVDDGTGIGEGEGYADYFSADFKHDASAFAEYMEGAALDIHPTLSFDKTPADKEDYIPYSSYIGSLYLGGNVGSMTYEGKNSMTLNAAITIYNKFVGGCNDAYVPAGDYNAAYDGGIIGSLAERANSDGYTEGSGENKKIKDRLELNFTPYEGKGIRFEPKRLTETGTTLDNALEWNTVKWEDYTAVPSGTTLTKDKKYYTSSKGAGEFTALGTEVADGSNYYEWTNGFVETGTGSGSGDATDDDIARRLLGGNVYGGCYHSGHVNGNIIINLENDLVKRDEVFAVVSNDPDRSLYDHPEDFKYHITQRNSGVILDEQGMDVLGSALNVFGGGYGKDSEVWGSTTINVKKSYTFQVFGGSEEGVIGKSIGAADPNAKDRSFDENGIYTFNGKEYEYNPAYSTTINLHGTADKYGTPRSDVNGREDMADIEFAYGGGFQGPVIGDTRVYLGNGRIFNSWGGACNADVLGHAETYIGKGLNASGLEEGGYPYIRDYTYGANDLGGRILNVRKFTVNLNNEDRIATTYTHYDQGYAIGIFGGCYGDYDYEDPKYKSCVGDYPPYNHNAVVDIRPDETITNSAFASFNHLSKVFGGGQGAAGPEGDKMQDHSYVLINLPFYNFPGYDEGKTPQPFRDTEVFGAGRRNGMGMRFSRLQTYEPDFNLDEATATIDLMSGQIGAAYGGSYEEGVTLRTVVNVPETSTIKIGSIFGGAYGLNYLTPCDVYEANVIYSSKDALLVYNPPRIDEDTKQPVGDPLQRGSIYGGNNNERRTIYSKVNINSPVKTEHWKYGSSTGYIFGAGLGADTWSEYTEVNLNDGAEVWEVYGGGQDGKVYNAQSVQKYMEDYAPGNNSGTEIPYEAWRLSGTYSDGSFYFDPLSDAQSSRDYTANNWTNLSNDRLVRTADEMDGRTKELLGNTGGKFNTNVIINEGAYVGNYAYGGGLGEYAKVAGTTYIALLGGKVNKDIYAAGTSGAVQDSVECKNFTASANVYIKGGTCRNVYGGGWNGEVGKHVGTIETEPVNDIPGETNVVIGDLYVEGNNFTSGIPAVTRNVYGGGEGAPIYGNSNVTINNGYIGYEYNAALQDDQETDHDERYVEKIDDDTHKDKDGNHIPNSRLYEAGCVFGGGYVDNSSVDKTFVNLYDGHIRNSVFGGGEIAAIGRGKMSVSSTGGKTTRTLVGIYRPGRTDVEMFGGHVHRNVFGGGRGYNNLNEHGKLNCDGYIFGQTEVHIHGGEIGTTAGTARGDGNVFGGGDIGYVYSAYEYEEVTSGNEKVVKFGRGVKPEGSERYKDDYQGYYYKHQWYGDNSTGSNIDFQGFFTETVTTGSTSKEERMLTEDCKVLIEPQCKVKTGETASFTGIHYAVGEKVATIDFNYLKENDSYKNKIDIFGNVIDPAGITFDRTYSAGTYVPIAALNTLKAKNDSEDKTTWGQLDDFGIIIHNAVFAGGNTSSGSTTNANTISVFGNATASVHDIYHRDMITLGTGHTGGLYGDGNLTLVDGYRELNITNYGTDYYSIKKEIKISEYKALPDREAAYYELKYKCKKTCQDKEHTWYYAEDGNTKASTITADDLLTLFLEYNETTKKYESVKDGTTAILNYNPTNEVWEPNDTYWEENGVLPVYAGRLMNSIQRADFCGVFGSRMVMQGAQDRVPETMDYTNYTINRVREVSLNKKISTAGDAVDTDGYMHGNYFGIYNIVNYLGALTSDVDFGGEDGAGDIRTTDNNNSIYKEDAKIQTGVDSENNPIYTNYVYNQPETDFYKWKKAFHQEHKRNNGNSHNKVALASGVYLELTTEESTGTDLNEKVWGPITGVIELDLINVQTGIGGGFVYAKNEHGKRSKTNYKNTTLTALNNGAVTKWDYQYDTSDNNKYEWETSGNFVHSTQTIIDDCYNVSGRYLSTDFVPAHYWFIKGQIYVYDQYISAYTGNPNAFSETIDIPLTIAAASHGKMHLINVQPNYYAYYASPGVKLESGKKIVINDKVYYLNDPISYWDYNLLSASEKELFKPETYVNCVDVCIDDDPVVHPAGTIVLTPNELANYGTHTYKDVEGNTIQDANKKNADEDYIFRSSNNVSHNRGYILTYKVNNPELWNTWYTKITPTGNEDKKISVSTFETKSTEDKLLYHDGPTYHLKSGTGSVLGQISYKVGELISLDVYDTYVKNINEDVNNNGTLDSGEDVNNNSQIDKKVTPEDGEQANFEEAYIVTQQVSIKDDETGETHHQNIGSTISKTKATTNTEYEGKAEPAYICTSTIKLSKDEFIYMNSKMTSGEKTGYVNSVKADMNKIMDGAGEYTPEEIKALGIETDKKKSLTSLVTLREEITKKIVPAYYCTKEGLFGGNYYESGKNYRGLEAWSSMSETDRQKFDFNYDALDLLIDSLYSKDEEGNIVHEEGQKYQYDSAAGTPDGAEANPATYSLATPIDYTATYNSNETKELGYDISIKRVENNVPTIVTDDEIKKGDELSREVYESLNNEQRHYAAIDVKTAGDYYIVNKTFQIGNTVYAVGTTIDNATFVSLQETDGEIVKNPEEIDIIPFSETGTYYYCRENYTIDKNPVRDREGKNYYNGDEVTIGTIISTADINVTTKGYSNLTDDEKLKYKEIDVEAAGDYYVINTAFENYNVGDNIDANTYNNLASDEKVKVTKLVFDSEDVGKKYYYCTNSYNIGNNDNAVKSIKGSNNNSYGAGATVPVGAIIGTDDTEHGLTFYRYSNLPNDQKNFTIHGISPTETSTFYVARNSDIYNLSKEKIITVIYQYDYEESDASGNVTPISERHVVNIHLQFKSGVPTVEDITQPDLILPGEYISMMEPDVTPGAYDITGGGWELFETPGDAESHINGIDYDPQYDPLYWYQDDWYVAYYAKTYLGRTYSNHVPVSVANYHDLAEVMSDANMKHHMYIDNNGVKREPKIYINDYTTNDPQTTKNGLDELKRLFDLSVLKNYSLDQEGLINGGKFEGHKPLAERVKGANKLQFILRTDIDHSPVTKPDTTTEDPDDTITENEWSPIANGENECFQGTLHGDGHKITGLTNSLFSKLCGNVYNLGVTGSFTGGGIADEGDGYAENCWISTTGTPDAENTLAIIGNPGDIPAKQIENCYYLNTNTYKAGPARPMPAKAFFNGEVAYNLNGFYLRKRYYDNNKSWTGTKVEYNYLQPNADGSLPNEMSTGDYPDNYAYYPIGTDDIARKRGYVEQRFKDGDYRYANGTIPDENDIRMRIVTEQDENNQDIDVVYFSPIWPDDYLYFGQALNYNQVTGLSHQELPAPIIRSNSRLLTNEYGNRVYRAPAYFRSKDMGVAYFNPYAIFTQSEKLTAEQIAADVTARDAHKNMTAIDFSGYNDMYAANGTKNAYELKFGPNDTSNKFYAPLLDDDGLTGFNNIDLTKNLLAYTFADGGKTATTVSAALADPTYTESTEGYRTVAANMYALQGHWVQKMANPANDGIKYESVNDHFLVDKNDFNAPISYKFASDKRMWYQRTPDDDEFVTLTQDALTKGWQGISLPFTAELVTTQQKGEISHFYKGSDTGHEYWLRKLKDITDKDANSNVKVANFTYPDPDNSNNKDVTNTFLWDYYYKGVQGGHDQKDANTDLYRTYYEKKREYNGYPLLTQATPYLIGFPGSTYYEFDLSGSFIPLNTAKEPAKLDKQTITFASNPAITIRVSDDEILEAEAEATKNGYIFRPSYMNQTLAAGTTAWALNSDGDRYNKVPATGDAVTVEAFRPYFTPVPSNGVREVNYIEFSNVASGTIEPDKDLQSRDTGRIEIYARGRSIVTVSGLKTAKTIHIVNATGALLASYTLEPGKTVITPVTAPGTYIVNKKKLYIK